MTQQEQRVNILLDFEMLGPGDAAKVIGVGASVFGLGSDDEPTARLVYEAWPISAARQDARTLTLDTIAWWSRQAPAVRDVAFAGIGGNARGEGGKPLRLAVKELVDATTLAAAEETSVTSELEVREIDRASPEVWRRITWWAKPAAADLSLWMSLLREFRPDLSMLYGRVRDARTLWDAAELATGVKVEEAPRDADDVHAPGADSLATAWACARAMRLLRRARLDPFEDGVVIDPRPASPENTCGPACGGWCQASGYGDRGVARCTGATLDPRPVGPTLTA